MMFRSCDHQLCQKAYKNLAKICHFFCRPVDLSRNALVNECHRYTGAAACDVSAKQRRRYKDAVIASDNTFSDAVIAHDIVIPCEEWVRCYRYVYQCERVLALLSRRLVLQCFVRLSGIDAASLYICCAHFQEIDRWRHGVVQGYGAAAWQTNDCFNVSCRRKAAYYWIGVYCWPTATRLMG